MPNDYRQRVAVALARCEPALKNRTLRRHPFPWRELTREPIFAKAGGFDLVGYGSLLHPDSARRTIRDTPDGGHPPVLAFGARRVFNYRMSAGGIARYGLSSDPREVAALNVDWSGDAADVLTGRLLRVSFDDLEAFRDRERGYHLEPVVYVPWDDPSAEPRTALTLRAGTEPVDGKAFVDDDALPFMPYVCICVEGARRVDPEFERAFLETTVLADRKTTLAEYLRDRPLPSAE